MTRRTKRESIIEMIKRGATPGERAAAKEALNRYDTAHPDEADAVQYYTNGFRSQPKPKPEDYQPGVRMRWEHDRQAESADWQRQRNAERSSRTAKQAPPRDTASKADRARHEYEYSREQTTRRDTEAATKRAWQQDPPKKPDKYGYFEHVQGDTRSVGEETTHLHFDGMPYGYAAPHEKQPSNTAFLALVIALLVMLVQALTGGL